MRLLAFAGGFVGGIILMVLGTWAWLIKEFHFK